MLGGFQKKMRMVAHQHQGVNAKPAPLTGCRERAQEGRPIRVVRTIASLRSPRAPANSARTARAIPRLPDAVATMSMNGLLPKSGSSGAMNAWKRH